MRSMYLEEEGFLLFQLALSLLGTARLLSEVLRLLLLTLLLSTLSSLA